MLPAILLLAAAQSSLKCTAFPDHPALRRRARHRWIARRADVLGGDVTSPGTSATWPCCRCAARTAPRKKRCGWNSAAKDAELRALQAQVNPHFFFNSMNSVRALVYEDPESAAQMIDQLASLMRYALQSGHHDTVPLSAELEAVRCLSRNRKNPLRGTHAGQRRNRPGLGQVRIPPMALQTLVENAVKYGVEASPTGSEIRIRAQRWKTA
jgi:hypothetical protein